jgi:hypothetical protein
VVPFTAGQFLFEASVVDIPSDLTTLPTMPYAERPDDLPLDVEECRTAIWMTKGNITEAADILKISSARLRRFVRASVYLSREVEEATERLKDKAMKVIDEGLNDENERFTMARFVMTNLGGDRGFGTKAAKVASPAAGPIVYSWQDDDVEEATVIEGEVVNG